MGQPIPADPPCARSPPRPPTGSSSSRPIPLPHHLRFNSPTYGLAPELVSLLDPPHGAVSVGSSAPAPDGDPDPDSLVHFAHSLDEPRRALEQAALRTRDSLARTLDFADRLDQLAHTLHSIAHRAAALSPALAAAADFRPPPSSPSSSPSSPSPTADGIRATVRQLLLASQRVSAAVDRHRDLVRGLEATSSSPAVDPVALPAVDEPLRVVVLSPPTATPRPNSVSASIINTMATTPPLFSPSALLPSPSPSPSARENYPGEHAQLHRIAVLQADLAGRADALRQIRERRERQVERVRGAIAGLQQEGSGEWVEDKEEEEDEEEEEHEEGEQRSTVWTSERVPLLGLASPPATDLPRHRGELGPRGRDRRSRSNDLPAVGGRKVDLERDYELYRIAGR